MQLMKNLKYLLFFIFTGCGQGALLLYQQKIDPSYLASTHVGSPDPRIRSQGQMIVAEWWVPRSLLDRDLFLRIDILFRDFTKAVVEYPIKKSIGYETYCLLDKKFEQTKGFLSYKAEIITEDGKVYAQWQHQLWVKLITIEDTEVSSSAVVEKSKQESVIEIPL